MNSSDYVETVVIGGGQAGLVAGYELQRRGRDFVILDAHSRTGDAWRTRWDSLRLFTPRRDCELPGLRITGQRSIAPTKDEMADYLERYATHHALPVRHGVRVTRLSKDGERFRIETDAGDITASNVVVATGSYAAAKTPAFAAELDPHIVQLHSSSYLNPQQLQPGGVLLVGAGNSGADISLEVVRDHQTWLAGPTLSHVPVDIDKLIPRHIVIRVVRFVQRNVLCLRTPIGRKAAPKLRGKGTPLIRQKPKWLEKAGVQRVGRVVGVHDGLPQLDDGQVIDVTNVIWCSGFRHDFPWIDLPGFDEQGSPVHRRGVATEMPGLYFLGLEFQFALASASLWGVARDATYIIKHLDKHAPALRTGIGSAHPARPTTSRPPSPARSDTRSTAVGPVQAR
ncbi:MAG: putative flavoprotein involved in transport [Frankiaceae bacterium]|nr:putative flavoprotein involved in transport [Frankiaceae bacterium]